MIQTEHQRRAYLEALGIDVWVPGDQAARGHDALDGPEPLKVLKEGLHW